MERWMTLNQLAETLQVSRDTLEKEIADGHLAIGKVRGQWRISPEDYATYCEYCKNNRQGKAMKLTRKRHKVSNTDLLAKI